MFLVDRCVLPPGCCIKCRSPRRETESAIVDTMCDITDGPYPDGRLYLCQTCVTQMATMFGFMTPERATVYVDERDAAIRQCTDLMAEVEALRAALAALTQWKPAETPALAATPRFWCEECQREFNGAAPLGRHRQAKHEAPPQFVLRGDEVIEMTTGAEVSA